MSKIATQSDFCGLVSRTLRCRLAFVVKIPLFAFCFCAPELVMGAAGLVSRKRAYPDDEMLLPGIELPEGGF